VIAFSLLLIAGFLLPVAPPFALLAGSLAFWAAKSWPVDVGETLELFVFYGAFGALLLAIFGIL
jgi:hypothetical protein